MQEFTVTEITHEQAQWLRETRAAMEDHAQQRDGWQPLPNGRKRMSMHRALQIVDAGDTHA
jgi:hypothetical protein